MRSSVFLLLGLLAMPLSAKDAQPMAADPVLELKVNEVSHELRCLVCQNQTIADSHAPLAIDLKNQVRQMLAQGKTKDEILKFMTDRYGDFVRYRPAINWRTLVLWLAPILIVLTGLIALFITLKKRHKIISAQTALSAEQQQHLDNLLK